MFKKFNYITPNNVKENGGIPEVTCAWCSTSFAVYEVNISTSKAITIMTKEGWVYISHRGTSGPCCPSCKEKLIDEVSQ